MENFYTVQLATQLLPEAKRRLAEIADLNRRMLAIATTLRAGTPVPSGMAEAKGLEARVHDAMYWFTQHNILIKGLGPDLLDFPAQTYDGRLIFLCWREGESELGFWHELDGGYLGRTPILPGGPRLAA